MEDVIARYKLHTKDVEKLDQQPCPELQVYSIFNSTRLNIFRFQASKRMCYYIWQLKDTSSIPQNLNDICTLLIEIKL